MAAVLLAASAMTAQGAAVSGPRQEVDNQLTTTRTNAPTGLSYTGRYHAAGDPSGAPPYMRRMTFSSPPGLRYDTTVPARCTASDLELALRGPAACPEGSRVGGGETDTSFMGGPPQTIPIDVFNNAGEQIIVARSPLFSTVARGTIHPDGSVEFASPTCYPSIPSTTCPVDSVLQLGTRMAAPAYVRAGRSYLTTPPTCPSVGYWETPITFWWEDGTVDTVVTRQSCTRGRR